MASKDMNTLSGRLLISDPNENELKFTKDFGSLEYLSKAESSKIVRIFGVCGDNPNHRKRFMKGILGGDFVRDTSSNLPCVHFAFRKSSSNDDYLLFLDIDNELWYSNNKLFYIFLFLCYRMYFSFELPNNENPNWLVRKFLECGEDIFSVYNKLPSVTFLHEDLEELEYHRIVSVLDNQSKKTFLESAMLPNLINGKLTEEEMNDPSTIQLTKKFFGMFGKASYYPLVDTPEELRKRIISRIRGDLFRNTFVGGEDDDEEEEEEEQRQRKGVPRTENIFTLDSLMTLLKDLVQLNNLGGMTNENFVKIMKLKKTIGKSMTEVTQKITNFEKILEVRKLKENEKLEKKIDALDMKEDLDNLKARLQKREREAEEQTNKMNEIMNNKLNQLQELIANLAKKKQKEEEIEGEEDDEVKQPTVEGMEKEDIMTEIESFGQKLEQKFDEEIKEVKEQTNENFENKMSELSSSQKKLQDDLSTQLEGIQTEVSNIRDQVTSIQSRKKIEEDEEDEENAKKTLEEIKKIEKRIKQQMKDLKSDVGTEVKQSITKSDTELQIALDNMDDRLKQAIQHQNDRFQINHSALTEQFETTMKASQKQQELTLQKRLFEVERIMENQVPKTKKKLIDEVEILKNELVEQQKQNLNNINESLHNLESRIGEISETSKMRQLNLERHYRDEFGKINKSFVSFEKRMSQFVAEQCKKSLKHAFLDMKKGLERQIEQKISIQREQQTQEWKNTQEVVLKQVGNQINNEFVKIEEQRKLSKEEFDIIINEMIRHEGNMEKFRKKMISTNKLFKSKLLGEVDYVLQEFKKRVIVGSLDKGLGGRVEAMETRVRSMKKFMDGLKRVGIVGVGTAPSFKYTKSKFYLQNLVDKNYSKMISDNKGIHSRVRRRSSSKNRKNLKNLSRLEQKEIEEEKYLMNDEKEVVKVDPEEVASHPVDRDGEEYDESLLKLSKVMEKKDVMDRKKRQQKEQLMKDKTLSLHEERTDEVQDDTNENNDDDDDDGIVQGDFNNSSLLDQIQPLSSANKE